MDTKRLSARLIELSNELTVEQRWYDRAYACLAKHMARGTQESRTEATGHVKHGANLRSERAAELRTLATEAPQAICAELYRLANTLETSADNVAGDISELAAAARSNAEPAKPTATEGAKLEGNGDDDEIDATYRAGGVATGEPLGTRFIGDVFRIEKTTITRKFHKRIADPRRKNAHLYSWDCVVKYFKANNQDAAELLATWQRSDK